MASSIGSGSGGRAEKRREDEGKHEGDREGRQHHAEEHPAERPEAVDHGDEVGEHPQREAQHHEREHRAQHRRDQHQHQIHRAERELHELEPDREQQHVLHRALAAREPADPADHRREQEDRAPRDGGEGDARGQRGGSLALGRAGDDLRGQEDDVDLPQKPAQRDGEQKQRPVVLAGDPHVEDRARGGRRVGQGHAQQAPKVAQRRRARAHGRLLDGRHLGRLPRRLNRAGGREPRGPEPHEGPRGQRPHQREARAGPDHARHEAVQEPQRARRHQRPEQRHARPEGADGPAQEARALRHEPGQEVEQHGCGEHPGEERAAQQRLKILISEIGLALEARPLAHEHQRAAQHQVGQRQILAARADLGRRDPPRAAVGRHDVGGQRHAGPRSASAPREPALEPRADVGGQRLVLDLLDGLGEERERQEVLGRGPRHAARAQVVERLRVDRAGGRAVRALHVVGVDLELGLGQELRIPVEEERLADLVAVGLLRPRPHQDLALEHAHGSVAQDLLEHLPALAAGRAVDHEHGVVVVELAVAHRRARDVRHGVRALQVDHALVAREPPVGRQREGLEGRSLAQAREQVRDGAPLVVAPLRADVVEGAPRGHVHLHALVEARRGGAVLQHGEIRAGLDAHDVVEHGVGALVLVVVDQRDRAGGAARDADQQAVRRRGGVERRQGTLHGILARGLQPAVKVSRPVKVGRGGQPMDLDDLAGEVVGRVGVEDAVAEHDLEAVHLAEELRLARVEEVGARRLGRRQGGGVGAAPVLVAPHRQARGAEPRERVLTCPRGPGGPIGDPEAREPLLGGLRLGRARGGAPSAHGGCSDHHATSERMSA